MSNLSTKLHYAIGFADEIEEIDDKFHVNMSLLPENIDSLPFQVLENKIVLEGVEAPKTVAALASAEQLLTERKVLRFEKEVKEFVAGAKKRRVMRRRVPRQPRVPDDEEEVDIIALLQATDFTLDDHRSMHVIQEEDRPYVIPEIRITDPPPEAAFNMYGDFGDEIPVYEASQRNLQEMNAQMIREGSSGRVAMADSSQPLQPGDLLLVPGAAVMPEITISERDRIAGTDEYRRRFHAQSEPGFVRPDVFRDIQGNIVHPPAAAVDRSLNNFLRNSKRFAEDRLPRIRQVKVPTPEEVANQPPAPRPRNINRRPVLMLDRSPHPVEATIARINRILDEGAPVPVFDFAAHIRETWAKMGYGQTVNVEPTAPSSEIPERYRKYRRSAVSSIQTLEEIWSMVTDFQTPRVRLTEFNAEFPDGRRNFKPLKDFIKVDKTFIVIKKK